MIVKKNWDYYCKQDIFLNEKCFFFIINTWGGIAILFVVQDIDFVSSKERQWPNFSVRCSESFIIQVRFSYFILNRDFDLVGISKQGYKHKQ